MTSIALPIPPVSAVGDATVSLSSGASVVVGAAVDGWTLMHAASGSATVWEDFTDPVGDLVVVAPDGRERRLSKSAEATTSDPAGLYLGHSLDEITRSEHDLLGRRLLVGDDDPDFDTVAGCLAPIRRAAQYTFVGHGATADKVGIEYGGRTPNFDPATLAPEIAGLHERGAVRDGLVGGWLPVVRFVFEGNSAWWEYIAFAPPRAPHHAVQPVWYRVARVDAGRLTWVRYVDSYVPTPFAAGSDERCRFYSELRALADESDATFIDALEVELPDRRLADQARHSLARALITHVRGFPKYGVLDRLYGAAEHDGFPDTFNTDTAAALEWGLTGVARAHLDNYLEHFVRDDGSLWYRGIETGQYGRMLTTIAHYLSCTGDLAIFDRHRGRITAIADVLRGGHAAAEERRADDPAFGVISGWCEADSCLEADPARYWQPYLSNSAEAARGFAALGAALGDHHDPGVAAWAAGLAAEAEQLRDELQRAIERSTFRDLDPPCIPAIAGAEEPYHVAVAADAGDPQFRAYRTFVELLHSGMLDEGHVRTIVAAREAHRDLIVGVPCAYGYLHGAALDDRAPELAGFLSYGHGYGLLHHGLTREFLLLLWSISAHQYTRGTWTAPETRLIDPDREVISYAVPAQVVVPLLVRWMLVFEDPTRDELSLLRAVPRTWFAVGQSVVARGAPTRWGRVTVESRATAEAVHVAVRINGAAPERVRVSVRLPLPQRITAAQTLDGRAVRFDADAEWIELPPAATEADVVVTWGPRCAEHLQ